MQLLTSSLPLCMTLICMFEQTVSKLMKNIWCKIEHCKISISYFMKSEILWMLLLHQRFFISLAKVYCCNICAVPCAVLQIKHIIQLFFVDCK